MNAHKARQDLAEHGVSLLKGVVSQTLLGLLREAVKANRAADRPMSRQVLYTHGKTPSDRPPLTALMDQWLSPFLYDGPGSTRAVADALRPLAADLLGEPGVLFQDLLLIKRQGQREFPWHQDFGYWPVDRPLGVVLWVPLQPSDGASGALRFAAGSHRLGTRPVVDLHNGKPQQASADTAFDPEAWPSYAPSYEAGDAVAFTPITFHASPPMHRPGERAAWSCIFLSPRARWSHANAPNHPLCKTVADGAPVTGSHMPEITREQRALFDEQGHIEVGPLVPPEQVSRLRRAFEEQAAIWAAQIDTSLDDYLTVVSQWTNVWEHNAVFRAQMFHQRAAAIAADLIGCERVRVFHDHLIVKPPHGGDTIPWHRDLPNWPVAEPRAVSCWLALDDVTTEAGAMRFMPGGHKDPITRSIDFLNEAKAWGDREGDAVPVPVPAGSAIFHHCLSWHTSPPNATAGWRRAYITIYLDAACTFDPERAGWHPMSGRVTVPPGAVFNEDAFPTLGPGLPAAALARAVGGAA